MSPAATIKSPTPDPRNFVASIAGVDAVHRQAGFLRVTCDNAKDLGVSGRNFTFGVVQAAQARGDFQVPAVRSRRALRVHLSDVDSGLATLRAATVKALA